MEYKRLDGSVSQAEPWSPGPVYQSVWALDGGRPVVISVAAKKFGVELAWTPPDPLPERITPKIRAWAEDVLHRRWLYAARRQYDTPNPSNWQVTLARKALRQHDRYEKLCRVYRQAHTTTVALSDKKFAELWKAENNADHT